MRSLIAKHFQPYLLLALLLACLAILPEPLQQWLSYQRTAIEHGQLWRLLSGHLLHSNVWHLAMNLAGLLLAMLLHSHYYPPRYTLINWLGCAVLISMLLYCFSPEIGLYVGLSGVLHAMLTLGAIKDIQLKQPTGALLLAGLLAKVAWEQWQGPDADLADLINASVAIDAHLYGVLAGLATGVFLLVVRPSDKN